MMKQVKWSHSLDNSVRACRRKAFYTEKYANPLSAEGTARKEAFLHKKAVDVPLWRGNLVHKTIEKCLLPALKKGEKPNFEMARNWMLRLIERQAEFSRNGDYRRFSKEKAGDIYCVLRAHLMGNEITEAELAEVKSTSLLALDNLETRFPELLERAQLSKKLEIEKEIRFSLDERIRIESIVDFIIEESNGRLVIVDWKAGFNLATNAREQLYVYAYAVINSGWWAKASCTNIELIEANLMTGESFDYSMMEDDLADVDDRIFTGAQLLEAVFERSAKEALPEDFAPAESPGTCEWCVMREICNGKLLPKQNIQPTLSFEFV
jgi:RecB family exonuclease